MTTSRAVLHTRALQHDVRLQDAPPFLCSNYMDYTVPGSLIGQVLKHTLFWGVCVCVCVCCIAVLSAATQHNQEVHNGLVLIFAQGDACTYNFKVGQQPHDISHVSKDEQASDSRQQGAGSPHHGATLYGGTRVIGELRRGNAHGFSCERDGRKQ